MVTNLFDYTFAFHKCIYPIIFPIIILSGQSSNCVYYHTVNAIILIIFLLTPLKQYIGFYKKAGMKTDGTESYGRLEIKTKGKGEPFL